MTKPKLEDIVRTPSERARGIIERIRNLDADFVNRNDPDRDYKLECIEDEIAEFIMESDRSRELLPPMEDDEFEVRFNGQKWKS